MATSLKSWTEPALKPVLWQEENVKNFTIIAMFIFVLMVAPRASYAQCCSIGDRIERVGTVILNRGADIVIVRDTNRTNEKIAKDSNRTAESINRRQMESMDKQTESYERIALEQERTRRDQIWSQRETEDRRTAADLCRDAVAKDAKSCTAEVGHSRASVRVERPANGGPMVF